MSKWDLPERPLEPKEPKGLACDGCGVTIYAGETYINWRGETLCMECALEAVRDELDMSGFRFYMEQIADMMNFDVLEARYGN